MFLFQLQAAMIVPNLALVSFAAKWQTKIPQRGLKMGVGGVAASAWSVLIVK